MTGCRMGRLPVHAQQPEGRAFRALGACQGLPPMVQRGAPHRDPRNPEGLSRWANLAGHATVASGSRSNMSAQKPTASTTGGRIDRAKRGPLHLRRQELLRLSAGDTLASALLANGVTPGRPLVQISPAARHPDRRPGRAERAHRGGHRRPHASPTPARPQIELYDGLVTRARRTAGRSLDFDHRRDQHA